MLQASSVVKNDDEEYQARLDDLAVHVPYLARALYLYRVRRIDLYWLVLVIGFDCVP